MVTSKRWEAVRDGIEDYSILSLLKQAINNVSQNVDQATIQAAKELFEKNAFEIAQYCGLDEYGTEPQTGGMNLLRQVEDERWAKIKATRENMISFLEKLKK